MKDKKVITSAADIDLDDLIDVYLKQGKLECTVLSKQLDKGFCQN
jgi:hypothetical protein